MEQLQYMIPCLLGLERLVADELLRLGMKDVRAENGRVFCQGTMADLPRLNINLRCGARVLLVLSRAGPLTPSSTPYLPASPS